MLPEKQADDYARYTAPRRNGQSLRCPAGGAEALRLVGAFWLLQAERYLESQTVYAVDAAAECDRRAAYGPCDVRDDRRCDRALAPHARRADAVAARHRPRRHRHAVAGREAAAQRRK